MFDEPWPYLSHGWALVAHREGRFRLPAHGALATLGYDVVSAAEPWDALRAIDRVDPLEVAVIGFPIEGFTEQMITILRERYAELRILLVTERVMVPPEIERMVDELLPEESGFFRLRELFQRALASKRRVGGQVPGG